MAMQVTVVARTLSQTSANHPSAEPTGPVTVGVTRPARQPGRLRIPLSAEFIAHTSALRASQRPVGASLGKAVKPRQALRQFATAVLSVSGEYRARP
jgi:hypothetical protein